MKRVLSLFLTLLLTLSIATACGKQNDTSATQTQPTEVRLDTCGLAYTVPSSWTTMDGFSVIPTSYAKPEGSLYAVVRYDFVPDDNLEAIAAAGDDESASAALMPTLAELVVIREGKETADLVQAEFAKFASKQELPAQTGFQYFYLTDPVVGTDQLSSASNQIYEKLLEDLPAFYESIETFVPDETALAEKAQEQNAMLSFQSTDLNNKEISSAVFADYDLTVVNFYASYSYPDINELAELEKFYQTLKTEHPNINFMQVIIDTPADAAEEKIKAAYQENGVTFTGIKPDLTLAKWIMNNLQGLPTTLFVDKDGKILDTKIEGKQTADMYMTTTMQMLDKMNGKTEASTEQKDANPTEAPTEKQDEATASDPA